MRREIHTEAAFNTAHFASILAQAYSQETVEQILCKLWRAQAQPSLGAGARAQSGGLQHELLQAQLLESFTKLMVNALYPARPAPFASRAVRRALFNATGRPQVTHLRCCNSTESAACQPTAA